jgi:hypothetical protein
MKERNMRGGCGRVSNCKLRSKTNGGGGGIPLEILKLINLKQVPILSKQVNVSFFFFYKPQINLLTSSFFLTHFYYIYSMSPVKKRLPVPKYPGGRVICILANLSPNTNPFHTLPPLTFPGSPFNTPHLSYSFPQVFLRANFRVKRTGNRVCISVCHMKGEAALCRLGLDICIVPVF